MFGVSFRQAFGYAVLPGIRPRAGALFASGFRFVSFFMALLFQAVRLLPAGHPYGRPGNMGRYGIRHVIAEAANNLNLSWKNADQIVVFVVILLGIGIALAQVFALLVNVFFGVAMAGVAMPTNFSGFFLTPDAQRPYDLAFMMLDMTFGVPGMFLSCVDRSVGVLCVDSVGRGIVDSSGAWILGGSWNNLQWPYPVHEGLHQMFQVYSVGLLVVGCIISAYFITTVLIETAETGVPFGKRFNKVWVPIRYVVAFGLLIPFGVGLNSAQYIVLYAAKFGSGFATNGWNIFNDSIGGAGGGTNRQTPAGDVNNLISKPQTPGIDGLLQFLFTTSTCYYAEYAKMFGNRAASSLSNAENDRLPWPYVVVDPARSQNHILIERPNNGQSNPTYQQVINLLTDGASGRTDGQITVRFGPRNPVAYPNEPGHVFPRCGELILPLADNRDPNNATNPPERAAVVMQAFYFALIGQIWWETFDGNPPDPGAAPGWVGVIYPDNYAVRYTQWVHDSAALLPDANLRVQLQTMYKDLTNAALTNPSLGGVSTWDPLIGTLGAIEEARQSTRFRFNDTLRNKGWAGAGIWYNKIAEINGLVSNAVFNVPIAARWPYDMEVVAEKQRKQNQSVDFAKRFKPELADGYTVNSDRPESLQMSVALWHAFDYWQSGDFAESTHTANENNAIVDFINKFLGTSGLYSMRNNDGVHPLAQLVGVGRSLIEASIRNLGIGAGASLFGALGAGPLASIAVSLITSIVTMSLTAGFVLYYLVPFLPFVYFFFAVGFWVKAIFEAMVGLPLWALAHLRIDGQGLPGDAAFKGYIIIFEIFLRPILIIFGLLASISIFAALVQGLNLSWELVVNNLSGFDVESEMTTTSAAIDFLRGPIDEFFFTVIYAIVVYMMATSSFKLIDIIPSKTLRWMGQDAEAFTGAKEGDFGSDLIGMGSYGGQQAISSLGGAIGKSLQAVAGGKGG